jgi:hypothetical protein
MAGRVARAVSNAPPSHRNHLVYLLRLQLRMLLQLFPEDQIRAMLDNEARQQRLSDALVPPGGDAPEEEDL